MSVTSAAVNFNFDHNPATTASAYNSLSNAADWSAIWAVTLGTGDNTDTAIRISRLWQLQTTTLGVLLDYKVATNTFTAQIRDSSSTIIDTLAVARGSFVPGLYFIALAHDDSVGANGTVYLYVVGASFTGSDSGAMSAAFLSGVGGGVTGFELGGFDSAQHFPVNGAIHGVWFRSHFITLTDLSAIYSDGHFDAPIALDNTGTGGNMNGTTGWLGGWGHAALASPSSGTSGMAGQTVATTNIQVFDSVQGGTDCAVVYSSQNAVTGTGAFADPFDYGFTPRECTLQATGVPVAGTADALHRVLNHTETGPTLIICHGNSHATRVNVDSYYGAPGGQCLPSGLAIKLKDSASHALVGCCVPAVSFSSFAMWPWRQDANPAKTGTVTTIYNGASTYDDFMRIGCGNNGAGDGIGAHTHLAASSSCQWCFDIRDADPLADIDPDTDDIIVFAVLPVFPGGGDIDIQAGKTVAINTTMASVGSATTASQAATAADATVVSWTAGSKTLVLDEISLAATTGTMLFIDSGTGAGSLMQATADGVEGGGDTTIVVSHTPKNTPGASASVKIGDLSWQVVTRTIPAGTLGATEFAAISATTGAGNAVGIVSFVGCYASKPGAVPVVFGHSGHGFALQTAESFLINDASGRNPYGNLVKTLVDHFTGRRHALLLHAATQGSTEADLGTWTDMVQAQAIDNLDLAWAIEGTNPSSDATYADDSSGSDYGDYGAANAAAQGVSCVASQVSGGVVSGRDALAKGYHANGGAHWSTRGNVAQWDVLFSQGATAWTLHGTTTTSLTSGMIGVGLGLWL